MFKSKLKNFLGNRKSGFTLIELLVVIAIIAILAGIVLASLSSARQKSRDARRISDIKQIQLALELYFDGVGKNNYPPANTTCSSTQSFGLEALSQNGYIPTVPRDPSSGDCYLYSTPSSNIVTYHLGARLEDPNHTALDEDQDCNSDGTAPACPGGVHTHPFSGADPIYDVIP